MLKLYFTKLWFLGINFLGDLEAKDYNGRTPLHLAINLDRTLVVEYLVSLPQPADVLTKDNLGNIAISCMIISTPGVVSSDGLSEV